LTSTLTRLMASLELRIRPECREKNGDNNKKSWVGWPH